MPGVPSLNKKRPCRVNKDLVIWPEPGMTTWDESWQPVRYPRAVLEWKVFRRIHRKPLLSQTNLLWLTAFCKQAPDCTGYAVVVDLESRAFKGQIARVTAAGIDEHWMEIG